MLSSVYIHIPFCNSICSYCDFCKMFYNEKIVDSYLLALNKEIEKRYKNEVINTLYIGGGTPSSLSIKQLEKLFEIIKKIKLSDDFEFTIEVNINDITEEMLYLFKKNKVNRLSIGVETVNEKYFSFLNRYSSREEVKTKVSLAKKYFSNINIDLMYAFPKETIKEVLSDLEFVINLEPQHISIYSLIIEEHTKVYIEKIKPIDEELESNMYYNIIDNLEKNNFYQYEISNFSLQGYESKHNLVYWNNEKYYGFGLGASGYIDDIRYTNTKSISKYLKEDYVFDSEIITKNIDMEYELILGLRKIEGIDKEKFKKKYSLNVDSIFDIIDMVNKKMLIDDKKRLYIPRDKLYVSNSILVNFIGGSKDE